MTPSKTGRAARISMLGFSAAALVTSLVFFRAGVQQEVFATFLLGEGAAVASLVIRARGTARAGARLGLAVAPLAIVTVPMLCVALWSKEALVGYALGFACAFGVAMSLIEGDAVSGRNLDSST